MKCYFLVLILFHVPFSSCYKTASKNESKVPFNKMYIVSFRMQYGTYDNPDNIHFSLYGCAEINQDFSATIFDQENSSIGSYPLPIKIPSDFEQNLVQLVDRYTRDSAYYNEPERPEVSNFPSYALIIEKENREYILLGGGGLGRGLPDDIREVIYTCFSEAKYVVDVSKLTPEFLASIEKKRSSTNWFKSKQDFMRHLLVDLYFNSSLYENRPPAVVIRNEKEGATS